MIENKKLCDKLNDVLSKRPEVNPKIDEIIQHDDKNIKGFFYQYRWMSNFHLCEIPFIGLNFPSTENAYMAAKSMDMSTQIKFQTLDAKEAKKLGRQIELRPDWEQIKYDIMYHVNLVKYTKHDDLREKLFATGDKYLEETNWWGDRIWGVCQGTGQNHLGRTLMKIREELR